MPVHAATIARVDVSALDLPLVEPFAIAGGAQARADIAVVRIELSDGTVGLGEAAPFPAVSGETREGSLAAIRAAAPLLLGADVRRWRALGSRLSSSERLLREPAARCALEMALLDAFASAHHLPLWSFFGGAGTDLETDMTITAGDAAHAAAAARAMQSRGIETIKIKIGALAPEADVERVCAVHAAFPGARLFVDANGGYTVAQAQKLIDAVSASGIALALFEQPVPRGDLAGMAELTARGTVPIAADESAASAADVFDIARRKTAHVVNLKTMKSGVLEAIAMAEIARAAGLGLMIGGMVESVLSMTFSAHFAAGFGGFSFVDLDTPMFIEQSPFIGGFVQEGGKLSVAGVGAGHGVKLPDFDFEPA